MRQFRLHPLGRALCWLGLLALFTTRLMWNGTTLRIHETDLGLAILAVMLGTLLWEES